MSEHPGHQFAPDFPWRGHEDGPSAEHRRWHHIVSPDWKGKHDVELIGFASDEGVRRRQGRPGAAQGPDAIREALTNLSAPQTRVADRGTLQCAGEDLERAQSALA